MFWILEKLLDVFKKQPDSLPTFRIVDYNVLDSEVKYQFCGKDIITTKRLDNILLEGLSYLGFSELDQQTILTLFAEKMNEKPLKIIMVSFEAGIAIVVLLNKSTEEIKHLTVHEALNDELIKNNLEKSCLERLFFLKNIEFNKEISKKKKESKMDREITVYYKKS